MACFFRRSIASKIAEILGQHEETCLSSLSTVPVTKKQQTPDFRLSLSHLRALGLLSPTEDIQTQADVLARRLKPDHVIEEVSAGRAVVNFRINRVVLAEKLLADVALHGHQFGVRSDLLSSLRRGRVLVEYSSPNIAKKFHAGHLRSTVVGNYIANLKAALGNDVVRMNYLGDWGMQFGLLGAGFKRFGSEEKLKENPLQHLFEVYVRVNRDVERDEQVRAESREFYRGLERGEEQAVGMWRRFREITVEEYQRVYARLGVRFDVYSGESFHQQGATAVLQQLHTQGLLSITDKGTGVVDLSPSKDMSCFSTVLRSDGTSLYITRDIAAAIQRKEEYNFDEMIYVTDKSQAGHFQQAFHILQAMGHTWVDGCRHVPFGLVQGMNTRLGEVVFLEDVLDEARSRMLRNMQESKTSKDLENPEATAEKVGIAALIVQDFKGPLVADYAFQWDRVLQSQGDTGVFLQYTHSRLCSLMRMHGNQEVGNWDPSVLQESQATSILQHLLRYDEVLLQCSLDLQPKLLVNYLMTLCRLVASALKVLSVKESPRPVAQARLHLFTCTSKVLASGMRLLGISPVEKM